MPAGRRAGAGFPAAGGRGGHLRLRAHAPWPRAGEPGAVDRLDSPGLAARYGGRRRGRGGDQAVIRGDARPGRAWGPLPALRRDRARRDGGGAQGTRPRFGSRPGGEGVAREPPREAGAGAAVRGGGADWRPAPASRHRPGLRAGHIRGPAALFHDEAGEGADAIGDAGRASIVRA